MRWVAVLLCAISGCASLVEQKVPFTSDPIGMKVSMKWHISNVFVDRVSPPIEGVTPIVWPINRNESIIVRFENANAVVEKEISCRCNVLVRLTLGLIVPESAYYWPKEISARAIDNGELVISEAW